MTKYTKTNILHVYLMNNFKHHRKLKRSWGWENFVRFLDRQQLKTKFERDVLLDCRLVYNNKSSSIPVVYSYVFYASETRVFCSSDLNSEILACVWRVITLFESRASYCYVHSFNCNLRLRQKTIFPRSLLLRFYRRRINTNKTYWNLRNVNSKIFQNTQKEQRQRYD